MNYKIVSLTLGLLFSSAVLADPFDGFYVGAGAGYIKGNTEHAIKQSVSGPLLGTVSAPTLHEDQSDNSWLAGVNLGYGKVVGENFYLGLDAAAQFEDIDTSFNRNSANLTTGSSAYLNGFTQLKNELALTFMPGFVIKQKTLIYGKVGPTWGYINNGVGTGYNGFVVSSAADERNEAYHTGLRLGAGVEHFLSDKLSVKLEYLNNNYFNVDTLKTSTPVAVIGIPTANFATSDKVHVYNNSIMLGLNYHFN